MLQIWISRWRKILIWLVYCIFCFQLSRFLMYIYHLNYFRDITVSELIKIFWGGLRFDWICIVIANTLLIFIFLFPFSIKNINYTFISVALATFIVFNLFLILNFIDVAYFSFIHKRSTVDIFFQLGGQTDIIKQIPAYIRDYWYLFILYFLLLYFNFRFFQKTVLSVRNEPHFSLSKKEWGYYIITFFCIVSLSVVSIRGGLQRIPLNIVDAGFYAEPSYTPLVINTPFSIIKSFEQQQLKSYFFFEDSENIKKLHLIKKYPFDKMIKKNIILIILESFSKEYTGLGAKISYTPFLDSLMNVSMLFENAWSNGTKSIEGIPAIISSIPSWMNNPYINSLYCNNNTHSLPILLKKESYYSAFFHGGINGTMNFDAYAKQAGFNAYYGKNEYNNNSDFDGYWGIWDEPFLQYTAHEISKFPQPFFASIFTLSSHHPFNIPDKYKNILPKGNLPIQQSIAYTDMALRKFFETIKNKAWYKNTLFIITADHTGISEDMYYSSVAGRYQIPLIIFNPDSAFKKTNKSIIQHIDILPTILFMLHYPHQFFSFGNNYFDQQISHYALYFENDNYYLADDSTLNQFRNFSAEHKWYYRNLQLKESKLFPTEKFRKEELLKRIIQSYNNTLIKNSI